MIHGVLSRLTWHFQHLCVKDSGELAELRRSMNRRDGLRE